tara:strand:+ start:124 stop:534 length:411 start_codon:yes stop_codon:yes gene_type:complete
METLSSKQLFLIEDLKDTIELYKDELDSQIKSHGIQIVIGVVLAVAMGGVLLFKPELISKLQELSEHMDTIAGLIGEVLPVAFISKAFNSSKVQKRKLKGLRVFEKSVTRMEFGVTPNAEIDIISVENDLAVYINT